MNFPRGNYYHIICKAGDEALRVQEMDHTKFDKAHVVGAVPNQNDNNQLWMIERVGLGEAEYELVNCVSTLVCTVDSKEMILRFGKQSKSQLFRVEPAPIEAFYKYFWIKNQKGDEAMAL
jgi:hypothetical protein